MALTDLKVPRLTRKTTAYKLLDKVCELIVDEPKRYNQGNWIALRDKTPDYSGGRDRFPVCGTICCVAGWVETLRVSPEHAYLIAEAPSLRDKDRYLIETEAQKTLGLTTKQARQLFNGDALEALVPTEDDIPRVGTPAYAELGVRHIRAFQRKHATKLKRKIVRPVLAHPAVREGR